LADITDRKEGKIRRRRGLLYFIGEIINLVFGNLGNEDAEYNEQIKHFEENSHDITKLLKQLFVVRPSLGAINTTITDMEYALFQSMPSFPKETTSPLPSKNSINVIYKVSNMQVYNKLGYITLRHFL
jgi:hypothetical protein